MLKNRHADRIIGLEAIVVLRLHRGSEADVPVPWVVAGRPNLALWPGDLLPGEAGGHDGDLLAAHSADFADATIEWTVRPPTLEPRHPWHDPSGLEGSCHPIPRLVPRSQLTPDLPEEGVSRDKIVCYGLMVRKRPKVAAAA